MLFYVLRFEGECYDCGSVEGFLKVNFVFGLVWVDVGIIIRDYVKSFDF